jgi:hypothetical protein
MEVGLDGWIWLVVVVFVWVGGLVGGEDEGLGTEEATRVGGVAGKEAHCR